jgi:hypothetical protein
VAYSGTYNQTKVDVDQLISYAYRDAGRTAEEITPEYIRAGKQALFYILQNSVNRGINIWLQEIVVMGAQTNQQVLTMPANCVDVLEANWIYIVNPTFTSTLPTSNANVPLLFDQSGNADLNLFATTTLLDNYFGAAYSQPTRLFYVGFNAYAPGGSATYNLDFQVSNDGITWTTWESFPTVTLADRQWQYYNIDPTQGFNYYRLNNRTAGSTYSLRAIQFAQSQQVIPMARLNRTDYFSLPNKQFPSQRSLQYWFNRQIDPEMYLWPVPNNNFQAFSMILECQPQDVGSLTNELYMPDRALPYFQTALSHKLALQFPDADIPRIAYLEKLALEARTQFEEEDRDKSPIYFQPNISYYTR